MASNLTGQVRNIAQVTTAVARGDLSQKITVDAHGEILELKNTVNTMVDQLSSFADEVTRVAREVGTEGKLGGQAQVRGRVRHLARPHRERQPARLARSPPSCARSPQVSTAVTRGDLTQQIAVEAQGEVAELKDNINQMIVDAARDHHGERRAGLARLQPRPHRRPAAGPARPRRGLPMIMQEVDAAGRTPRSARSSWPPIRASSRMRARPPLGDVRRLRGPLQDPPRDVRARRGPGRPGRGEPADASGVTERARRATWTCAPGPVDRRRRRDRRAARAVRGRVARGDRVRLRHAVLRRCT